MQRRNPRAGLTLLELLIALWVMAAAALILASSLGLTGRALVRVGSDAADIGPLTDRNRLRHWIESMPPGATLSGDSTSLAFATLIDEPPRDMASLTDVQLALIEGTLRAIAGPSDTPALTATLSETATGLTIRYYGSPLPNSQSVWHDDWPATAIALPDLIRIDYTSDVALAPPLSVIPALASRQSEISLSSPEPPG
jgi:hypothetical protein